MSSNSYKQLIFKFWLFPFAWLYGWAIRFRHFLFDKGILSSLAYPIPVICVGNLSTGGTGKTPMVLYLLDLLSDIQVATLSRGYKRKSKGFILACPDSTARLLGDEPFLFYESFPKAYVSVGEDRRRAIKQLLSMSKPPQVIILDDGFQHRKVAPGFSILLTDFRQIFSRDYFLPVGNLRDSRSAAARAQMIVVTKCPEQLDLASKEKITAELQKYGPKIVLFSYIKYLKPISLINGNPAITNSGLKILLIHGIANARSLQAYVRKMDPDFKEITYEDHHDYTQSDIQTIKSNFSRLPAGNQMILTTEKDGVKLKKFHDALKDLPIYVLPIQMDFLFQQREQFQNEIRCFIENFNN